MPLYEYGCRVCGARFESLRRADNEPCECGANAPRRYGFRMIRSSFTGGYNPSVGKYVGSMGELRSEMARESERQSRELGMDVDIQPVDYGDREACGITDADVAAMTEERAKAELPL